MRAMQALMHWSGKLLPSVFRGWARVVTALRNRRTACVGADESYETHLLRRAVRCWRRSVQARLAQRRLLRHAVARLAGSKLFLRFQSWCAASGMHMKVPSQGMHAAPACETSDCIGGSMLEMRSCEICSGDQQPRLASPTRFDAWSHMVWVRHDRCAALEAAQQAAATAQNAYRTRFLRKPFGEWLTAAHGMRRRADTLQLCAGRLRQRAAALAFQRWRSVVADMRRQRDIVESSLRHLIHR